ncbi:MAG: SMP-30/gluconolactonase/LRE family protein [Acuticoccus sp.]
MSAMNFRPLVEQRFHGGEGPTWDERRGLVFFVDMAGAAVHAASLDGETLLTFTPPEPPYSLALCESGRILVAITRSLVLLDPETGTFTPFAEVGAVPPHARLNDGKTGPDGAFWVGSMDLSPERQPIGRMFRVTADGVRQVDGFAAMTSNGLAWTADGRRMIHTDSRGQWIDRWDFDAATGTASNRERIASPSEAIGRPDGGACDMDGTYWSAGVSAGCLNRWSLTGEHLASHPVPAPAPSMPCFCGPDLKTVVVTSLTPDPHRGNPDSGMLMIGDAAVAGAPVGRLTGL